MKNKIKILAIKPGTKILGVAILEGENLIFRKIKYIRTKRLKEKEILSKAREIIFKLIKRFQPDIMVVEKITHPLAKGSFLLNNIVKEIRNTAKECKLKICSFSQKEIQKFFCRNEKPTKLKTAEIICSFYPWLYRDYEKEKNKAWFRFKYHLRMFDAVALARYCLFKLKYD